MPNPRVRPPDPAGPAPLRGITPVLLETEGWPDYALVDSGHGRKLERYGEVTVVRPEPQALWTPRDPGAWEDAQATFAPGEGDEEAAGRWRFGARRPPEAWDLAYGPARLRARFGSFRHVGLFPEQAPHWDAMVDLVRGARTPPSVLNLFAYTGAASLLLAAAGARVTHVDASRKAIAWARENQALSGLEDRPIRWICDDAMKFVAREVRRGQRYDGIILDPPKWGRGPAGEVWDLFAGLPDLMRACRALLADTPLFLVMTVYSIRASFLAFHELAAEVLADRGGVLESGELAIREEARDGPDARPLPRRLLPTSLFVRWSP